ncbi:MAG: hypothetical protein AAF667_13625 [Pseudomonadota bacterium]
MPPNAQIGRLIALREAGALSDSEFNVAKRDVVNATRGGKWAGRMLPEAREAETGPAFNRGPQLMALATLTVITMVQSDVSLAVTLSFGAAALIFGTTLSIGNRSVA